MKPSWIWQDKDKWLVRSEKGYTLLIITELRKLVGSKIIKQEFPDGFQFKIHAYSLVNPNEFVRIDNHDHKPPHYHFDNKEEFFVWVSWEETKKFFYELACQRFGYFEWNH
ncbi:MAG: hypothetical protein GBAus27B_000458 [Mycoplasmataceae bacterium]|nr:MAG: hypothetical protein GBAus27B_000458 [Mycoplasmataceae bacterium]